MKAVVFGAGSSGKLAVHAMGSSNIHCFIDNKKAGSHIEGIPVFAFSYLEHLDNPLVIIASFDYYEEMSRQLSENGYTNYFVFSREIYHSALQYAANSYSYRINSSWYKCDFVEKIFNTDFLRCSNVVAYVSAKIADFIYWCLRMACDSAEVKMITRDDDGSNSVSLPEFEKLQMDCFLNFVPRNEFTLFHPERLNADNNSGYKVMNYCDAAVNVIEHDPAIMKYRNAYNGKRCFLIGNGPSLTVDDLDRLASNGEITFACNKIYNLFHQTQFRPSFYCISDDSILKYNMDDILNLGCPVKIMPNYDGFLPNTREESIIKINLLYEEFFPQQPRFSSDCSRLFFWGNTVTYDIMLQFAAYCGFTEIYLLGCDYNFNSGGIRETLHFQNYYDNKEIEYYENERMNNNEFDFRNSGLSYCAAEQHSRNNGYRIYNATRGGKLEVFERVDFDTLFGEKK